MICGPLEGGTVAACSGWPVTELSSVPSKPDRLARQAASRSNSVRRAALCVAGRFRGNAPL